MGTKLKNIWTEYKKLLIGGLLCLIVAVLTVSLLIICNAVGDIKDSNLTQLGKVSEKYEEISGYSELMGGLYRASHIQEAAAIGKMLQSQPADLDNVQRMNRYVKSLDGLDNLIIMNESRKTVYSYGTIRPVNYQDSYYDALFTLDDNTWYEMAEKEHPNRKTASVKYGDYTLMVQLNEEDSAEANYSDTQVWRAAFFCVGLETGSYFAVVDSGDNTVIYSDLSGLTGETATIDENTGTYFRTEEGVCLVQSLNREDLGVRLYAILPLKSVLSQCSSTIFILVFLFIIAVVLLISYVFYLNEGKQDLKTEFCFLNRYFLKSQTGKYRIVATLTGFSTCILFLLISNFNRNLYIMESLENDSQRVTEAVSQITALREEISNGRNDLFYGYGRFADVFLSEHGEYLSKSGLGEVAEFFDAEYLTLLDENGKTVLTSSPLDHLDILEDPDSSLYELRYVLMGKEGVTVPADSSKMEENEIVYAVPRRDAEGVADGAVALITAGEMTGQTGENPEQSRLALLDVRREGYDTALLMVNNDGTILAADRDEIGGQVPESIILDSDTLFDGYSGGMLIGEKNYLAAVSRISGSDVYLYLIAPMEWFSASVVTNCLIAFLLLLLIAALICYYGLGSETPFEQRREDVSGADDRTEQNPDWNKLSAEAKMRKIVSWIIYAFAAYIIITRILVNRGFIGKSWITYIMTEEWTKSFNVYSVLGNLCVICIIYTCLSFTEKFLSKIETVVGSEGDTICRLIANLIRYFGIIQCLFIVATNFGVDAKAVLASLGLLGFGLTIGAQGLIKDLIAGLFILFEGNYKIGDMLSVDGEWYWVKSIGVRTTILSSFGKVKVVNNSEMTGIVNIQNSVTYMDCDLAITSDVDCDYVEQVFTKELPRLREILPPNVDTPEYIGIRSISKDDYTVRIRIYCAPLDKNWAGNMFLHEVKRIVEENQIELSGDSLDIHFFPGERDENSDDSKATGDKRNN